MESTPIVKKTQTSFIPKNNQTIRRKKRYYNLFFGFSVIILFIVLGIWGGLIIYNKTLLNEKNKAEDELKTIMKDISSEGKIKELQELQLMLNSAEKLLDDHVNIDPLFSLLGELTLTDSVRFNNMNFSFENGEYSVSMSGKAKDFESLAYQQQLFKENPFINNVDFSGLSVDEVTSNVSFSVDFTVNKDLISYKKQVEVEETQEGTEEDVNNNQ